MRSARVLALAAGTSDFPNVAEIVAGTIPGTAKVAEDAETSSCGTIAGTALAKDAEIAAGTIAGTAAEVAADKIAACPIDGTSAAGKIAGTSGVVEETEIAVGRTDDPAKVVEDAVGAIIAGTPEVAKFAWGCHRYSARHRAIVLQYCQPIVMLVRQRTLHCRNCQSYLRSKTGRSKTGRNDLEPEWVVGRWVN